MANFEPMQRVFYNVIGVMSGTSLDGVDLAHIRFEWHDGNWQFEIGACETVPYTSDWVIRLKEAVSWSRPQLHQLNIDYTDLLGSLIRDFIERNEVSKLDAVCSHGHTILHNPAEGYTLQIGNRPEIAARTGQTVVCDFRVQDVALGGQGAPLVPIGDRLLFADYTYCLNLGGFSNVSFEEEGRRIAFDISPVNTVLNHYARMMGWDYDDRGRFAATGQVMPALLAALDALDFYTKPYPKSLGFEFVKDTILPLLDQFPVDTNDLMATFIEHIARQVALALPVKEGRMLVTGGGAYNDFLIGRMQAHLPQLEIIIPDRKTLEFKEALIFALLGVLKLRGETNVLASVTGASHDHCSGVVYKV